MANPTISVINFGIQLPDSEAQQTIRAVNRQITEDFAPVWGAAWELALHASPADPANPDTLEDEPVRGDGVLYIVDESTLAGALGFHSINASEMPFGFVFLLNQADWTVTLSHEAMEMIVDPTANVLVPGPDPRDPSGGNVVLHAYEVCDAVERTSYELDGIRVSNFVTPNWFFEGNPPGTRNDFLGVGVPSFGATQDSHLAFFDLNEGWITFLGQHGPQAADLTKIQTQRFEQFQYSRRRPEEEDEEKLIRVLARCKKEPSKLAAGKPGGGLYRVEALTRTGRKKVVAEKLFSARR